VAFSGIRAIYFSPNPRVARSETPASPLDRGFFYAGRYIEFRFNVNCLTPTQAIP